MTLLHRRASISVRLQRGVAGAGTGRPTAPRVGAIVGVEHEFIVRLDGRAIDFRQVIHRLPIRGQRIDAGDSNAYRGPWGGLITADGAEAEIATPPVTVGPFAAARLAAIAAAGAAELAGALPFGASLEGYSTHISVEVPRGSEGRAAREIVARWVPALTWFLDDADSPGILVRPRPGRVEIGGDFIDGDRLGLAAIFAVGAVRAAVEATRPTAGFRRWTPLGRRVARLPRLAVRPADAVERYGWFVGDEELGTSLHGAGFEAVLPLSSGHQLPAREHLWRAWAVARAMLGDIDGATLDRLEAAVVDAPDWPIGSGATVAEAPPAGSDPSLVAWVSAARHHIRPGFVATPAVMSWDFVVLRLRDETHEAFACLPRDVLGSALDALDAGRLDTLLAGYLGAERDDGRILASSGQTNAAGVFRALGRAVDLVTPERGPTGGGGKRQRSNDRRPDQNSSSTPASSAATPSALASAAVVGAAGLTILGLPAAAAAAAAAAVGIVAVAVVGGAVLLGGHTTAPSPSGSNAALASASGGAGSGVSDPLCDPLLTTSAIASTLGVAPTSVLSNLNDPLVPGYPKDVACVWRLIDGRSFELQLSYEFDQSYVTFKLASVGASVTGLGESAAFLPGSPNTLGWGVGQAPARMLYLHGTLDQASMEALAHAVVIPSAPTATPANLASAACDPWLTAAEVATATGLTPISIDGYNYLNTGQPADCTWTFSDGSRLTFVALEDVEYGGPSLYFFDGVLQPGAGMTQVFGLPGLAFSEGPSGGPPPQLNWFPDDVLELEMASTTLDVDSLKAIALLVKVPPNWKAATPSS